MSAQRRRSTRSRNARPPFSFLVINAAFVLAMVLVAVWAAWPIYQSGEYLVMAGGAITAGGAIAWFSLAGGWSGFRTLLVTCGAYLVLAVPLAIPSALGNILTATVELLNATVLSWRQLVTISIPVGSYQSMLVPAFIMFLGGTTAALVLAWRAPKMHVLVIPALFVAQLFGLVFGSSHTDLPDVGLPLPPVRESLIGLAGIALAVGYLVWRSHDARRSALNRARPVAATRRPGSRQPISRRNAVAERSGLKTLTAAGGWRRARRILLAAGVFVLAAGIALPLVAAFNPADRVVLRTAIDPEVRLREFVSPLSQYRGYFTDERFGDELFTIHTDAPDALAPETDRVRLAVLSHYDGEVFRVVDPAAGTADQQTAFARVPSTIPSDDAPGSTTRVRATVTVGGYTDAWLPLVGDLGAVDFTGDRRRALADGFYYNIDTAAGIQLNRLETGDSYTVDAHVADDPVTLVDLPAPQVAAAADDPLIPASLVDWVRLQQVGTDGRALDELIDRLRARGYLSHALTVSSDQGRSTWATELGDYVFEPSLAGHSVDRIDQLFQSLLQKQRGTAATEDRTLVAAVGDDEQFSVAAALLARHLGFTSRVVLGFDLADTGAIDPCANGVCAGRNLTAWVEVRADDGRWAQVDVTPQYENPLAPADNEKRDPKNDTEVLPATATEQAPPEGNPTGGDANEPTEAEEPEDLGSLLAVLKIIGITLLVVLVLATPFLTILIAKWQRRRNRRRAPEAVTRIANGWDEYVDAAVDHGLAPPGVRTRVETATGYGSPQGVELATIADQAVFGPPTGQSVAADDFWRIVDEERRSFGTDQGWRRRVRGALSLRSFARFLGTKTRQGNR